MGGITRMHDPSELAHDRVRRRVMNSAFLLIALLIGVDLWFCGLNWRRVLLVVGWVVGALPLALLVRACELRFKMAQEEWRRVISELPPRARGSFAFYLGLWMTTAVGLPLWLGKASGGSLWQPWDISWSLAGIWASDFFTYFRHRHERLRHLYMVTAALDDMRSFRNGVFCAMPALLIQTGMLAGIL